MTIYTHATLPAEYPEWLRLANWTEADLVIENETVIWQGGTWEGGVWEGGIWRGGTWQGGIWRGGTWQGGIWDGGVWEGGVWGGGTWQGGTWQGGVWQGGIWRGGTWERGTWEVGIWQGGIWQGGVWRGGIWRGGRSVATRAFYPVLSDNDSIWIGCTKFSRDEISKLLSGTKTHPATPPYGSEAYQLLRASVIAACAYQDALRDTVAPTATRTLNGEPWPALADTEVSK